MKFKPWSKDQMNEIEEKDLLPDGIYKFHVLRGRIPDVDGQGRGVWRENG